MSSHIGNAANMALRWAGHLLISRSLHAERAKKLGKFTEEPRLLPEPGQHLDLSTRRQVGTSISRQAQLQRLPKHRLAKRDTNPEPEVLARVHSNTIAVPPAPAENTSTNINLLRRKAQARASEQLARKALTEKKPESSPITNIEDVADRIYRLMQRDVILEKERSTKLGG